MFAYLDLERQQLARRLRSTVADLPSSSGMIPSMKSHGDVQDVSDRQARTRDWLTCWSDGGYRTALLQDNSRVAWLELLVELRERQKIQALY
jgi:hypothetical protein